MSQYWGTGRIGITRSITYTAGAGTIGTGFSTGVAKARVVTTTDAFVIIGKDVTASNTCCYMPALVPEYFTVSPGEVLSAIQVTTGGSVYVTEIP